jgi:hypothetical protein
VLEGVCEGVDVLGWIHWHWFHVPVVLTKSRGENMGWMVAGVRTGMLGFVVEPDYIRSGEQGYPE